MLTPPKVIILMQLTLSLLLKIIQPIPQVKQTQLIATLLIKRIQPMLQQLMAALMPTTTNLKITLLEIAPQLEMVSITIQMTQFHGGYGY